VDFAVDFNESGLVELHDRTVFVAAKAAEIEPLGPGVREHRVKLGVAVWESHPGVCPHRDDGRPELVALLADGDFVHLAGCGVVAFRLQQIGDRARRFGLEDRRLSARAIVHRCAYRGGGIEMDRARHPAGSR
jgi:hypothetical protein